jgi:hypothetical protein
MRTEWSQVTAGLSLLCCAVLLLVGCSFKRQPTVLGTGVVTPGASRTDQVTPSDETASQKADDSRAACGPSPGTQQSTGSTPAVPAPFRDDQAELDADGQTGDGHTVLVEEVQLSRADGFVAVCRLDDNRLLGLLPIARSTDDRPVRINLDEPITTTTRLLVVLYADNRDGHFDWATDPRVSGDDYDITDLEVERLTYRVR